MKIIRAKNESVLFDENTIIITLRMAAYITGITFNLRKITWKERIYN
jgi:hypothetical protein